MENKRILITGPLGHIGSKFIHNIKPGDFEEVILIDNLSTQRYCSLFNLPKGVPFKFIEADILEVDFESLCKGVDVIVHLAAITDAANSFEIADKVEHVNFEGTARVARASVANSCRLVLFSTTSVYGTQEKLVDENCSAEELIPQSPYAASKLKAERLLQELGKSDGLKFVICRFGTIYGTSIGMRFHTAINKFCWQACLGLPITIWRTALHQKRPYLALNDAVRALQFIIENDLFDQNVYNVVTENLTVSYIVQLIEKYVQEIKIQYVDTKIMNQLSYEVSNLHFKKQGFEFTGSAEQGIKETIRLIGNAMMMRA
jgi:nucleoside-diphosphate-sugar epimerase